MERDPDPSTVKPALDYERGFTVSRRQWRMLMLLTLLNTGLLGWFVVGPQTTRLIQAQWSQWQARRAAAAKERALLSFQQQCMDYIPPKDQVVYTDDPTEARDLVTNQPGYSPVINTGQPVEAWGPPAIAARGPAYWTSYVRGGGVGSPSVPLLYLGRRTTPNGAERLVFVQLQAQQRFVGTFVTPDGALGTTSETLRLLVAAAIDPATPGHPASRGAELRMMLLLPETTVSRKAPAPWDLGERHTLVLYTGQSDSSDPSHFTIAYRVDGKPGVIDGWLRDEGLLIKPQQGNPTVYEGVRAWEMLPPATQPGRAIAPGR